MRQLLHNSQVGKIEEKEIKMIKSGNEREHEHLDPFFSVDLSEVTYLFVSPFMVPSPALG